MTDNLYLTQARTRKALHLVSVARSRGYVASEIAHDAILRADLLAEADTRSASVDTWAMVVTMLGHAEQDDAEGIDPFEQVRVSQESQTDMDS